MAGALTSATWKLNNGAPTALTVTDGAVSESVDLNIAGCIASSSEKKTMLINKVLFSGVDEDGVGKEEAVFIARDFHKQLFSGTIMSATGVQVDTSTTLQTFMGTSGVPEIGFWMPAVHNGTSWVAGGFTANQLNDLGQIGGTIRIGAKLTYVVSTTTKYKYVDLPTTATSWVIAGAVTPVGNIKAHPATPATTATVTNVARAYVSCSPIDSFTDKVFTLFGLSFGDVDPGSTMKIQLFAYVGASIASPTASEPSGIGLIADVNSATYWEKSQSRVSGTSLVNIGLSSTNAYNSETFASEGLGWVSNFDTGGTTDTSITVTMGTS